MLRSRKTLTARQIGCFISRSESGANYSCFAYQKYLSNLCYRFARACLQHRKRADNIVNRVFAEERLSIFPLARYQSFAVHDCLPSASIS
jgi:hypothetical protein